MPFVVLPGLSRVSITSLGGVAALLLFSIFATLSVTSYPGGFVPFDMWLGEYGLPDMNPKGATYYNIGIMLAGASLIGFYAGFFQYKAANIPRKVLQVAGMLSGILSGASLFLWGFLTQAGMQGVQTASFSFFVFTALAILFLHLAYRSCSGYGDAAECMAVASIALIALLGISEVVFDVDPIVAEWCTIFAVGAWIGLVSMDSYTLSWNSCRGPSR